MRDPVSKFMADVTLAFDWRFATSFQFFVHFSSGMILDFVHDAGGMIPDFVT